MTSDGLMIRVSRGYGQASTRLAAFDEALRAAGVADFNLIRLSSVIPPGSTVTVTGPQDQLVGGFGDALYCVYAAATASEPGAEACAGVGWARRQDGSGAGLFAEHSGSSEEEVRGLLRSTLGDMSANRGGNFSYEADLISQVRCECDPVSAVVVATYRAAGWAP